ncbi:hypothetical protein [Cohnella rhizosphaerae]|uniref:Uncharacterized protein n=1 Tax=Cohnella rhizosphaerae TaxID=1457232 RepID=A0A9X4KZR0_9BACL|nr:hypothetical protein [Cohnella rhizosphaerae]MDG0814341.1 hypothetical protein [Cohnella rhizosphaerae]
MFAAAGWQARPGGSVTVNGADRRSIVADGAAMLEEPVTLEAGANMTIHY